MQYKLVKCVSYKADRTVGDEWWEVQYLSTSKKWWFFGERVWKTFKEPLCSGDDFYVNLKFKDDMKAREFVNRCQQNLPASNIVKTEVWTLCG
jgi:hypothetical protein